MGGEIVVGIDLGTTNSAIAYVNDDGLVELVTNEFDKKTIPSVVQFPSVDEVVVGWEAKQQIPLYPEVTAQFFKRDMGIESFYSFHGRDWTPVTLSAEILKKLKSDAEAHTGRAIRKAVVTVPAYFKDGQRRATREAAELAGLEVLQIFNEPAAAAVAYGQNRLTKPERALIYDLGGGTFDVTVADLTANGVHILGQDGNSVLGGKDWDDLLLQVACETFEAAHGSNPLDDPVAFHELLLRVEELKKSLSSVSRATLVVNHDGHRERIEITRELFAELAAPLMAETRSVVSRLLAELSLNESQIDTVILAGGSTRMPMVVEQLEQLFGSTPNRNVNPDECVAQGAAAYADLLTGKKIRKFLGGGASGSAAGLQKISDVSAHSMGMIVISADGERYENNVLLRKNTPIPAEVTEIKDLQTAPNVDNTWDVFLLQGESPIPTENSVLGRFTFHGVPHHKGRTRVKVHYTYDQSTIGRVEGFDEKSGRGLGEAEFVPGPLDIGWSLESPSSQRPQDMDVVFLVDVSGSMGGEIEGVKASCENFARSIEKGGSHVRLGLVGFGIGGRGARSTKDYEVHCLSTYTIGVYGLAAPKDFRGNIQNLKIGLFGGGGCYLADEDTVEIFPHVLGLFGSSESKAIARGERQSAARGRRKVLIIVSDEIGQTSGLQKIMAMLGDAGVVAYVLGVPGCSGAHERIATETGGQFWDILSSKGSQDFSGLLEAVAQTIAQNLPQGMIK